MKPLEKRFFLKIFIPGLILILISWILYTVSDPLMKGAALVALLFFATFSFFVIRKQWQNREDFKIPAWVFITLQVIHQIPEHPDFRQLLDSPEDSDPPE